EMKTEISKKKALSLLQLIEETFLDLVFPGNIYCICCGKPIDNTALYSVCPSCVRRLSWVDRDFCEHCGKPLSLYSDDGICEDCKNESRVFERGSTCLRYGYIERDLIHDLKYKEKPYLAKHFGVLMYERLLVEGIEEDLIVSVPMNRKKETKRGYNQAELLAKAIARQSGKPWVPHLLERLKDTTPMSHLGAVERRENIRGAFGIKKEKVPLIDHKSILLVDDVFTTGSTADACAEVLLSAGANSVSVITFAAGVDLPTKIK
ncbi:MAG: ComF family protein, partial [Eubacteriales bacterium]|nr:ComF family protein [Eubacteriales bacterium]